MRIWGNVVALCLAMVAFEVGADEVLVGTIEAQTWNSTLDRMTDRSFAVKLDTETGGCSLLFWDWLNSAWYSLGTEELTILRTTLDKYFEWESLAQAKAVKIQKEIPNSALECPVVWKYGKEWHHAWSPSTVTFVVFSQSPQRHQLVIEGTKVTSQTNQFIDFTLEGVYLDHDQVAELAMLLDQGTLDAKVREVRDQAAVEEEFQ